MITIRSHNTPVAIKGILLAGWALLPAVAQAQNGGYYMQPSVSVEAVYDDNIYFDPMGEVDDVITRVSPRFEAGFESEPLTWQGSYTFDSEAYDENSNLDSYLVRRFGDASLRWLPNQQLTLLANAGYGKTLTPGELNLLTGFLPGRVEAERITLNPGMIYAFNGATSASLEYIWNKDDLAGGVQSDVHTTNAGVEHVLNGENTLTLGYTYRSYEFDDTTSTYSHTPKVGWLHQLSPRTLLTLEAGPRISGDESDPYVLAALAHEFVRGEFEIEYTMDETTLIGQSGRVETESVRSTLTYAFGANFDVALRPIWSQIERGDAEAEVFSFAMDARYRVNNALFLLASYQHSNQDVEIPVLGPQDLSRNVFSLGFTLTYPRPTGGETEI